MTSGDQLLERCGVAIVETDGPLGRKYKAKFMERH
jgi:hypothetical protein